MMCYTPKWLWDCWENNLMRTLVMGLNIGMRTEDDKNKKKKVLIDYLLKHIKVNILGAHLAPLLFMLQLHNVLYVHW